MSGRRQGLRKSARKGTGSSTENVAAYDSTFDSEAELCPAQNSGIEQMLHHATSENEQDKCLDTDNEREVSNSQKHAVETAENVANETRRHDFLCGTLNNLCDSETAESDQEVRGEAPDEHFRSLHTNPAIGSRWVESKGKNVDHRAGDTKIQTTESIVEKDETLARKLAEQEMLRRDAAMARDLASREVCENVENVSSEQLKLKMTNRELYEERENVA